MTALSPRPPREAYTEEAWLKREQETLFPHSWFFAACRFDFSKAGDFKTLRIGTASLVVVQTKEGALKAFHNLCRHRGVELIDEEKGNIGNNFICPYHRWTYGLNGELRGMPDKTTCFADLERDQWGLRFC